nr:MAG TPA: Nucleotide modification associated domain 1 [Caudoviricetes sp.]
MEWKMIDKMNTEMKEESKNSKSAKGSNDTGLSIETLKQMGYNYPCTARRIIEDMEQGKDPKSIDSGLIRSLLTIEGHGHIFHSFVLSYTKIYPEENPSCKESKDYILLIDRRWVPSNNGRLLGKFVDAICDGKTVEEALECLKEEETKEAVKPEEGTPAPANHDSEGEKVQIKTEGRSDVIEVNTAAACDDTAKAKDSDKEEATEKRPNNLWTQSINDIEFTRIEFDKAKAKQAAKSEAPCDLQCAVSFCKDIFEKKCGLYGLSFSEMHLETLTDQLFMKANILKRRLTDRDKSQRLGFAFFEGIRDEFAAVVNYGVIALWQGGFGVLHSLVPEAPIKFYTDQMNAALSLISDKGDEYGELWRRLRIGTFADMIYTKVRRLKGIEDQYRFGSMTKEDYHKFAGDQYRDLINYGLFGVVRMTEIADVLLLEMEEDETNEEEGYE